jgi:hypothetical protein
LVRTVYIGQRDLSVRKRVHQQILEETLVMIVKEREGGEALEKKMSPGSQVHWPVPKSRP